MTHDYLLPPVLENSQGETRKAGFELEFGNLSVLETARGLEKALGGYIEHKNPFNVKVIDSKLGAIKVERDQHNLSSTSYREYLEELGIDFSPGSLAHELEMNIDNASSIILPCEVVTEPIPFKDLHKLDDIVNCLNELGAMGTHDSVTFAYGLHINPSIPDNSSKTLLKFLQSFLLLSDLIIDVSHTDLTRRFLTKYIDPFPDEYIDYTLDNQYSPTIETLIRDYMKHNPTRNRSLDMLPIFCDINKDLVFKFLKETEKKLVNGRPAFHYRLPDCRIGLKGWTTATAWNQWVHVEKLAYDDALRKQLIDAYPRQKSSFQLNARNKWLKQLKAILQDHDFFEAGAFEDQKTR